MRASKVICPVCQSPYPLWRMIIRFGSHICPSCRTKLAFTLKSAQRLGALFGVIGSAILIPLIFIGGPDIIRSWRFWVVAVVVSYFAGGVISAFVARFATDEEVRASAGRWEF